jgi:hypothetical protein
MCSGARREGGTALWETRAFFAGFRGIIPGDSAARQASARIDFHQLARDVFGVAHRVRLQRGLVF